MHLKLQCKQDALPYQYIADSIETSLHLSQSEQSVVKKRMSEFLFTGQGYQVLAVSLQQKNIVNCQLSIVN